MVPALLLLLVIVNHIYPTFRSLPGELAPDLALIVAMFGGFVYAPSSAAALGFGAGLLQDIMAALILAFLLLLLRLWYLQVIEGEHFAALSENNRIRIIPQRAIRGQILDRNGKVLVDNRPSFTLSVLPEETAKLDLLIPRLKDQLPIRWEEVEPKLKIAYAYRTIQLAKDLTREQVAYV